MRAVARLLVLALLWPYAAMAATGSAAVDTFYVRPTADCTFSGDGMAYNCAASAGASGAWRGLNTIIWTVTTGVDDGDTLYVCGTFGPNDKRNTTTMLDVAPASGGGANEAGRIYVNGNCSARGGAFKATIDGSIGDGTYATSSAALVNSGNPSYVTVKNFKLYGDRPPSQLGGGATITTGTGTGVILEYIESYPNKLGVLLNGTNTVLRYSTIDARSGTPDDVTDAVQLSTNFISGTITNNTIYSNATGNSSDVIDMSAASMTGVTVSYNDFWKGLGDKSTIALKSSSATVYVIGNTFHGQGDESYGFRTEHAFAGTAYIIGNSFEPYGTTLGTAMQFDNADVSANYIVTGNVVRGSKYQIAVGDRATLKAYGNTLSEAGTASFYSNGTAPLGPVSVDFRNNALYATTRFIQSSNFEDAMTLNCNSYSGGADFFIAGSARANVAAVTAAVPTYETLAVTAAQGFVGGTAPGTVGGFQLSPTSALKRAGCAINSGTYTSYGGRAFLTPPSIGAYEVSDPTPRTVAPTRTAAPVRTAR